MKLNRTLLLVALSFLISCASQPNEASQREEISGQAAQWSYFGETGPENWAQLDPDFLLCSQGVRQSPIDLSAEPAQAGTDPELTLVSSRPHLLNNGHTIEVALADVQRLSLNSAEYELLQFHFHSPSEHAIQGREFPLEIHFVFQSEARVAVLGVLVVEGSANSVLETFWADLPQNQGEQGHLANPIDLASLFPENRSQFRYPGSLTTPPCTEGVRWVVFQEPIELSAEQIETIARILGKNQRPRQEQAEREIVLDLKDSTS